MSHLFSSSVAPADSARGIPLRRGLLALAATAMAALGGCAVYSPAQPVYADNGQGVIYTQPAPVQEVVTVQPAVNMVWTPGIWIWSGTRHYWRPGHWAPRSPYHVGRASWAGHPRSERWHAPRGPRSSVQMRMRSGGWRR